MYYANILTGGIGCGKSTTARLLALHGLHIIDADIIAHEALESAAAEVIAVFGSSILVDSQIHGDSYCDSDNPANVATSQLPLGGLQGFGRKEYESIHTPPKQAQIHESVMLSEAKHLFAQNSEIPLQYNKRDSSLSPKVQNDKIHESVPARAGREVEGASKIHESYILNPAPTQIKAEFYESTPPLGGLQDLERKINESSSPYSAATSCHVERSETSPNTTPFEQSKTSLNPTAHHKDSPHKALSNTKQPQPTIDRKKLGALIFQDSEKKAQLEQILHPIIHRNIMQECERLEQRKTPFFIDLPLYFESKHNYPARFVVCVYAPKHIQIERIQKRNGYTLTEAQSRVDSQLDIETKRAQSHFVIDNTQDLKALQHNVETFLHEFLSRYT